MLSILSLYILLQVLRYCMAGGIDCKDWVKRLNAKENDALSTIEDNWDSCGPAFLEDASPEGIEMLFQNLKNCSVVAIYQIVYDITDTDKFASRINVEQLEILITNGATISSRFFAEVADIENFSDSSESRAGLSENLLEYYDGPMKNTSWMTPKQFKLFGSKLDKKILCENLESYSINSNLLDSISLECFRGLVRSDLSLDTWSKICPEIIEEWTNHLEEDLPKVPSRNYLVFPVSVYQKILELSKLLTFLPDCSHLNKKRMRRVSLSDIGQARFAEIARERPDVAEMLLESPESELPDDIFASCGGNEMKIFEPMLKSSAALNKPEIIEHISRDVEDADHYCKSVSIETYKTQLWLRDSCSDKCRSFISVPDGYNKDDVPELSNDKTVWESHITRINNLKSDSLENYLDLQNTLWLIKLRKKFCELMAEKITEGTLDHLEHLNSSVLGAIGAECALALSSHITNNVARKLGPQAFQLFTAGDFKLRLADLCSEQVHHLSKRVPKELSAFTKIKTADILDCSDDTFGVLTDSQMDEMQKAPEHNEWIAFRRRAGQLIKNSWQGNLKRSFNTCCGFRNRETLGFEYTECINVLARIITRTSDNSGITSLYVLFDGADILPLLYELPNKSVLLKEITRSSFDLAEDFITAHNGQRYDLAQSLQMIKAVPRILAHPKSSVAHDDTYGDGPLRSWLGELLDMMKTTMISSMSDVDASVVKFKFPIKGNDGFPAGFLAGKAMQQNVKLPFPIDPEFYGIVLNASEDEIETYFKETYAHELAIFRDQNLYQRVMGDDFEPTPEEMGQFEQNQAKSPKEMERARNKAWFNRNKEDARWAPLDKLTFNGFESQTNYNLYEIPREGLDLEEWYAKCEAVYSGFEYENMEEFFDQFSERCLQEFKTFVESFRLGLDHFLKMPDSPVINKQPFSEMLASKINGTLLTAEEVFPKINVEEGVDIDSEYGPVDRKLFLKTFLECLTPKQLSKFVAVWTGAASTDLDFVKPKVSFYAPSNDHIPFDSCDANKQMCAKSSSVVIRDGEEHEAFLRQFSARLRDVTGSTDDLVDPLSHGKKCVDFYPSVGSATCFATLRLPEQGARETVEALIELLNDDPSNTQDVPPPLEDDGPPSLEDDGPPPLEDDVSFPLEGVSLAVENAVPLREGDPSEAEASRESNSS
ncbi:hypothetical protein PSACC_03654 [Paramicrosporidium saccamoebae]|uniref:HECT domain-containing protein n=1 Tax=Paramicrosporidium saccamoebae TaxID=1246581 RepID=A0A2H9TFH4_9FUNG|nr:hypothetical protein PSACC_03654 [Paramicrosporidium saccamoebae]